MASTVGITMITTRLARYNLSLCGESRIPASRSRSTRHLPYPTTKSQPDPNRPLARFEIADTPSMPTIKAATGLFLSDNDRS